MVVGIDDGIGQSADRSHDRHRAVDQAIHLIEATWLELTRHQEDIAARFDLMRQFFVVADRRGDLVGMSDCQLFQHPFVVRIATAQKHQLDVLVEQYVGALADQREALLPRHARHAAEQRNIGQHGEAEPLLQRGLARRLACLHGVRRVLLREVRVSGRVPDFRIDSVQDAYEITAARAERTM